MNIFTNKGVFKKLIVILVAFMVFSMVVPNNISFASQSDVSTGGVLLSPIADLLTFLGDVIMDTIHKVIYDLPQSMIKIDTDYTFLEILGMALAFIAAAALIVAACAALIHLAPAIISGIAGALGVGAEFALTSGAIVAIAGTAIGGGTIAAMYVNSTFNDDVAVFPMFQITPEEIFKGEVAMLNINFFKDEDEIKEEFKEEEINIATMQMTNKITIVNSNDNWWTTDQTAGVWNLPTEAEKGLNDKLSELGCDAKVSLPVGSNSTQKRKWVFVDHHGDKFGREATIVSEKSSMDATSMEDDYMLYTLTVEQGEIIGGEVSTLGLDLKNVIAKWYYAIRNFALIIMMVILVYIGIRIMLCGVASEKAKYKNMLMDWVVAICLIFIMHYIMAFSMNLVDGIIKIFGSIENDVLSNSSYQKEANYITLYERTDKLVTGLEKAGIIADDITGEANGKKVILWDAGNILGMVRIQAAIADSGSYLYVGYTMCYLVLVFFTVFFLFTYLKRALYLTFFTIIAPLVAMTYPLDKLHDGKAQAFDMWFKEYIFNLMIQPVHLLLYTVLMSSAFELATENILYTMVAIGFMMPAEKFLRKMFGFDKAQTPGFLSGATGTALMAAGFNKIFNNKHSKSENDSNNAISDGSKANKGDKVTNTTTMTDDSSFMKEAGSKLSSQPEEKTGVEKVPGSKNGGVDSDRQGKIPPGFLQNGEFDMSYFSKPAVDSVPTTTSTMSNDVTWEASKVEKAKKEKYNKSLKGRWEKFKASTEKKTRPLRSYAKSYAGQRLQRAANNIASGKPIKTISRMAGGLALGATGAMLGATLALADDEPMKKMGQYVPSLGAAGYALGSRNSKPNYDTEAAFEEYERAKYDSDEEYKKAQRKEQTNKIIRNQHNLNKVREYLGDDFGIRTQDDAKLFMEKHRDFIDAGYDDMEDFCTLAKLVETGQMDKTMAATTAKYYKKAGGKPKSLGKKEKENIQYICENIAKSNGITDKEEIKNTVDIMFKNLNLYGDTKDGFTTVNN